MMQCGHCTNRYEGSWAVHTSSPEHQSWMRTSGQRMRAQLNSLDRIFAVRLAEQEKDRQGQLRLMDL